MPNLVVPMFIFRLAICPLYLRDQLYGITDNSLTVDYHGRRCQPPGARRFPSSIILLGYR